MYEASDSFGRRLKRLNINHLSFKTYSPRLPSPIRELPEIPIRSVKNSMGLPLGPIESEHVPLSRTNSVGTLILPQSKHSPMKPSIKKKPFSIHKEAEEIMAIQPPGQEVPVGNFFDKNYQLSDSKIFSPIGSLAKLKNNPFQIKLPLNTPKNGRTSEGARKSPKITPRQIENPDSLKKLSMSNVTQNKEADAASQKALNLRLIGKVFEAHAMSVYSARASSSQTTRREKPRDFLKLFSPRMPHNHDHDHDHGSTPHAKTARSRASPDPKEKEKKFVNKGKFEVVKRPCKLSSDTHYDLMDRQKRNDYQVKRIRKGADLGSLEFFKKIQIDVKESMNLFRDQQFSLFKNSQKKMTSSLKLENVETIKNIVRGDVISRKPV